MDGNDKVDFLLAMISLHVFIWSRFSDGSGIGNFCLFYQSHTQYPTGFTLGFPSWLYDHQSVQWALDIHTVIPIFVDDYKMLVRKHPVNSVRYPLCEWCCDLPGNKPF